MTSDATTLIAVAGTLVGTLSGLGVSVSLEHKRAVDADAHRNHEVRVKTAMDFLGAFDAYRRDLRVGTDDAVHRSPQRLADVIGRLNLFFDPPVPMRAEEAQLAVEAAKKKTGQDRLDAIKAATVPRDKARDAMKLQLEPRGARRKWWKPGSRRETASGSASSAQA